MRVHIRLLRRSILLSAFLALLLAAPGAWLASGGVAAPSSDPHTLVDQAGPAATLERFLGLPDPTGWSVDPATGLAFRRATAQEIGDNGWAPGAFLVEAAPIVPGAPTLSILVPLAEGEARGVALTLTTAQTTTDVLAKRLDAPAEARTPAFCWYESRGPAEAILVTGEGVGLYGRVAVEGAQAEVRGSEPSWRLEALGGAPAPASLLLVQLAATVDKIVVGIPDAGPLPVTLALAVHRFGLFGEMKWCAANVANWPALLAFTGLEMTAGFAGTNVRMVPTAFSCWVETDAARAASCDWSGGCRDGSNRPYTFNACRGVSTCYRDRAWSEVSHSRHFFDFPSLKIAQVQHQGVMDSGTICGLSRFSPGGDSVAVGNPYLGVTGCKAHVSTHEAGHSFDATHERAAPVGACWTVMRQSALATCRVDDFSDPNTAVINGCVGARAATCPRSGSG